MIWKSIITALSIFGSIWFGRLAWIAGQHSGTGYLGELVVYGLITIICAVIAIGFGILLIIN